MELTGRRGSPAVDGPPFMALLSLQRGLRYFTQLTAFNGRSSDVTPTG